VLVESDENDDDLVDNLMDIDETPPAAVTFLQVGSAFKRIQVYCEANNLPSSDIMALNRLENRIHRHHSHVQRPSSQSPSFLNINQMLELKFI